MPSVAVAVFTIRAACRMMGRRSLPDMSVLKVGRRKRANPIKQGIFEKELPMRRASLEFSEAKLRKMSADPASRGNDFTDGGCRGLVVYIARDGVVTFTYRQRVPGKGRIFEKLGMWGPAFTLAHARDAANARRSEISVHGLKPKVENVTLEASIPKYETARRNKDAQASRRRAPLPENWQEHITRFKKVFAPLLSYDVNALSRNDFQRCMDEYGEKWSREHERPWDPRVLRPMMVHVMPMLRWYTKRYRLEAREIEDLVPPDYDKDTRYLLPGEWQACAPFIDEMPEECGLFARFIFATCVRSETALGMQWSEITWGNFQTWKDADGTEHRALIWIPPRERMKGRKKAGGENLPRRILLTGESLAILERLRAIYEANRAKDEDYLGVFTRRMVTRWRSARTAMQRTVERCAGTRRWDRMTLRHTHATYLQALGCPKRLVTMSMNHTPDETGAASVTNVYAGADPVRRFMANDPLAELAPWHLRLHRLIWDIERGFQSNDVTLVQESMKYGQQARDMMERYNIPARWIDINATRLRVVK